MLISRLAGSKTVPLVVLTSMVLAAGALAFPPGNAGDTVADNVLGQPDFIHNVANIPDAASLNTVNDMSHVAIDKNRHVYVADANNNRILGYASISALTNGQPATLVIGQPDFFSTTSNQGGATSANTLSQPAGLAVDSVNNLYVADSSNNRVLVYLTPFTKNAGVPGSGDSTADVVIGQGGDFTAAGCNPPGTPDAETLCNPKGLTLDPSDNLWVADQNNHRVLEYYSPLFNSAANFVIGQPDFLHSNCNQGGGASQSTLCNPTSVAADSHSNIYVTDSSNNRVLEYNTPLSSNNQIANHVWGQSGFTSGFCTVSQTGLCTPTGVGLDASNNLYIADAGNQRILEYKETTNPPSNLTADLVFGQRTSFTTRTCNSGDVPGTTDPVTLCNPQDVELNGSTLVAADTNNNRILIYNTPLTSQAANIVLGQPDFVHLAANSVDKEGMDNVAGIAIDKSNHLYVADFANNRVLGFTNAASFANGAPAFLVIGQLDFFHSSCNQGGPLNAATLCFPESAATDSVGNLYVSDLNNNRVLEYNTPFSQGKTQGFTANRVYGQGGSFTTGGCNQNGLSANSLCGPRGLALDTHNNLYIADASNNRVLVYMGTSPTATKEFGQDATGINFTTNTLNKNGLGQSSLWNPWGVATDGKNNVYIADRQNSRVLEFNETANPPANFTANVVFGQNGFNLSFCNPGGTTANTLCTPHKLTLDGQSNLYIADAGNNRVLEYNTPLTKGTTAATVFGQADNFTSNRCNFNAGPSPTGLCGPVGLALDSAQDLFVGDFTNNRVVKYMQPLAKPGIVKLAPSPVAFGSVVKGTISPVKMVTATNSGIVPVLFTGFSITGANAGDFKASANTCLGYLKVGAACSLNLAFTPTALAGTAESATLMVFDKGINSPPTVSLTGTSGAGQTTVLPTSVPFGNVKAGTTSAAHVVTVTNNQSVAITLSPAPKISSGAPTFKISTTTCGASVPASGTCSVSITCTPPSVTAFGGNLMITDSPDGASPHNVSLSCTGTS